MSNQKRDVGMTVARFAALIEAYGAAPRRWPASERAAAEALLADSAEARALRDAAADLDAVLALSAEPAPSAELRAALLRAAPRRDAVKRPRGPWRDLLGGLVAELGGLRPAGAVLGLALVSGIVFGGTVGGGTASVADGAGIEDVDVMQLAMFDDQVAEY